MKKNRIRLSALALTFVLLLSLFSSAAFAQEPEPSAEYEYDSAVAFAQEPEPYTEYEYGSAAAEITAAEKEYRFWATGDSRWKDMTLGKSGKTVAEKGSTVVAVAKIIMQAGLNKEPDFNVATYVTWLNEHNCFQDGLLLWGAAAGYSAQLKNAGELASGTNLNSDEYTERILKWIHDGYHLVIASSNYHWFAVDEGRSLATGQVYIMDSRTIASEYNTGMLLTETYPTINAIHAYTGGTTHAHSLKENLEPATCEARGYLELECTSCGESYLKDILTPLGHDMVTTTVAPTCSAQGYTLHSCTRGDFSEKTDFTAMTGHSFVETKVEATCIAQGYTFRDCTNCEYTDKINFTPPLGHDYVKTVVDATETEKGYTKYECFRCPYSYTSDYVDPHAHVWSAWKVTTASTSSTYGKRSSTCTVVGCSAVKTENLPWLCPFADVASDQYFYTAVLWAAGRTPFITNGITNTTFCPEWECTRGQVVTFLWRSAGSPEPTCTNPFTDVTATDYFYKAVLWAYQNGITNGVDATRFAPTASVTRGMFVTFLYRMAGSPSLKSTDNPFVDVTNDIGNYYYTPVLWANENGITNGVDPTHFAPMTTCTRAHVVTFLYRYYGE